MAANFGNTIIEGEIAPSVAVQAPVQDNSGAILAESLGGAAKTIGAIAGTIFQQGQVDANGKILTAYENELLDLADAVDQDAIGRDEAMIQARALRRSYLSNAPALQEDFDKIWTNFATANGLGHVVVEGTVEQKALDAKQSEALKLGYPDMASYDLFLSRARQQQAVDQEIAALEAAGKVPTLQQHNRYVQAMVGVADAAFPSAQAQMEVAMQQIQANPATKADVTAAFNLSMGQQIAAIKAKSGSIDAAYITTPIEELMTTFNAWSNGTVELAVLENAKKTAQLKTEAMYTSDPILGPVIAASQILGDLGMGDTTVAGALFDSEFITRLKQTVDGKPVDIFSNTSGDNLFSEGIKEVAGTLTSGSEPALVQEVMNNLNAVVEGAYAYERTSATDGLGYKNFVELMGSEQVANAIAIGGSLTAANQDKVSAILKENYENVLLPAISNFWEETDVSSLESIRFTSTGPTQERLTGTVSSFLQPVWNGSAVEFIPKPGFKGNAEVISLANEVNVGGSSIGVPLNDLINAHANLTGVDAKTIWEQDFAGRLFGMVDGKPVEAPLAVEPAVIGNIDINNRPVVNNADGSISTEQSISIGVDGMEVLIPTVINGKVVSEEEAIAHYEQTGEHLGKFNTVEEANAFAETLHQRQEEAYQPTEEQTAAKFTIADFQPDSPDAINEFVRQDSAITANASLPALDPVAYENVEGINFQSYLPSIRASESGGNDSAANPTSTALGRYQFLKSTWDGIVNKYPEAGLSKDGRTDPAQQEIAIRIFTAENARTLKGNGVPLSNGTLYAAHFLGASDAVKVLKAGSGMVSDYVPAKVIQANPFLKGMTVQQFRVWADGKGNA